jgi:enamine deaminase RidA (YjgF/YER057c/UK114 family)
MEREVHNPEELMTPYGYSQVMAIKGGGTMVFCAGQSGVDANGDTVGGFREQAVQAYKNLKTALAAVGATPNDLVKTTNFIVDFDDSMIPDMRDARNEVMAYDVPPPSSLIGIAALARDDLLIEVEGVAVID